MRKGVLLCALYLLAGRTAGSISASSTMVVSSDGASFFDAPTRIVEAPPPLVARGTLEMAEIPAARRPSGFMLTDPVGRAYGPFALEDGAAVGAPLRPFRLERFREEDFRLVDPRSHVSYGPFAATNGALVTVGPAVLTFTRLPASLLIRLVHRAAVGTPPIVAAGEWTPALQAALFELQAALVDVANRLAYETAPVTIKNMPAVVPPPWGNRWTSTVAGDGEKTMSVTWGEDFSGDVIDYLSGDEGKTMNITRLRGNRRTPAVRRSLRDRETARHAAERSATLLLETFMRKHLRLPLARDPDGSYLIRPAPADAVVVCALWRVRDGDAITASASRTAVWWTTVAADPLSEAHLIFNEDQAGDWRGVFRLPPLRN